MSSDDLAARILAAISHVEHVAKLATAGPWTARVDGSVDARIGCVAHYEYVHYDGSGEPIFQEDAEHIALNDPQTVLRRCAADRELVEDAQVALAQVDSSGRYVQQPGDSLEEDDIAAIEGAVAVRLDVLRNRARVYGITVEAP